MKNLTRDFESGEIFWKPARVVRRPPAQVFGLGLPGSRILIDAGCSILMPFLKRV
jgi:hypothetical protein